MIPNKILICLCALLLVTAAAGAAERPWYLGAGAGQFMPEESAFDDLGIAGFNFGYKFLEGGQGSVAAEFMFATSPSEADFSEVVDGTLTSGEYEGDLFGLYGVYRTAGKVYLKGLAGVTHSEADFQGVAVNPFGVEAFSGSEDSDDFTVGLGGGWKLSEQVSLELEWMRPDAGENADVFMFGVLF